jgi:hypothetical protein
MNLRALTFLQPHLSSVYQISGGVAFVVWMADFTFKFQSRYNTDFRRYGLNPILGLNEIYLFLYLFIKMDLTSDMVCDVI